MASAETLDDRGALQPAMIYNFQALRAVAAFMVLFVHAQLLARPLGLTEQHLSFGNIGVDLFFVLSGFVIVYSAMRRPQSATGFALNRILRVVPLYWVLTLAVFAVAVVAPMLLNSTDTNVQELIKSLLFIPYQKANGLVQPVLFVGWTLNYEMFFYLAFAAALAVCRSDPRRAVWLASIGLTVFVIWVQVTRPDNIGLRFFGFTIVLEFVMGMWIALAARHIWRMSRWLAVALLMIGAAALILYVVFLPSAPRWIFAGVPAACILVACLALERHGNRAGGRLIQLLGAASYALYLSHPFVLQGLGKLLEPVNSPALAIPAIAFGFVMAHAVGVAVHLWLEKPLVNTLRGLRGRRRTGRPDLRGPADGV